VAKTKTSGANKKTTAHENVKNQIMLDELIPVMSLLDYTLNLLTSEHSNRAKYMFKKFGESKEILYQDVLRIIEEYRPFMESGYFIILDERVIERHGLQDISKSVLDKDMINKIFENSNDAMRLYNGCIAEQKQTIIGMITRKLTENPDSVDQNLVYQITRDSGVKIQENADSARLLFTKEKNED
jgi:hypothetical protein